MTFAHAAATPFETAPPPVLMRRPGRLDRSSLEPGRTARPAAAASVVPPVMRSEGGTWAGPEAYSQSIARLFNLPSAPTGTTATLKTAQLAVSRLESAMSGTGLSAPLPMEKAYLVALNLRDSGRNSLWKAGRRTPSVPFVAGSIVIAHLEDEPAFDLLDPFDLMLIHIPQIVFDELADDHGAPRIHALSDVAGPVDAVVQHLGGALAPYLETAQPGSQLFFDHIAFAIHTRLALRFGRIQPRTVGRREGLSAWQERTAKAALAGDLAQEPSLAKVAIACGLPLGRFVRAFRQTTGMPPFRWLRAFRVERARDLLLNSPLALAQIAYDCGFADQSHFTRVFTAIVGVTPGAWRRARRA
jgi:AraC family transcriptional regulator